MNERHDRERKGVRNPSESSDDDEGGGGMKCFKCGGRGHKATFCPKKKGNGGAPAGGFKLT